jgi:catechol 2,3-dioxygenase-like lactoylglutathione lyase family enzyme
MRWLLLIAASAASALAQLPAPNAAGVSMGHLHLMVNDPEEHKKLWVGLLSGEVTKAGALEMIRFPGIYLVIGKARTAPTEGTDGSTVAHIGFLVKDLAAVKAKLDAQKIECAAVNNSTTQCMAKFPEKVTVELTEEKTISTPTAMHHIHLASPKQEEIRAWYVKTFGATAGVRNNFLAARIPGGEVNTRAAEQAQAPTRGRSLDHIGFEVKNLEAFCKKLEAEGVKFEVPYRDVPQLGLKIAFLTDPEGTRIELTEGLAGK